MATQSKSSKAFGKILSVVLCLTILMTTYAGFFGGFGAAASALDIAALAAGEVGINKTVVQNGRGADLTIDVAAKPVTGTTTNEQVEEAVLDAVIIIDISNSMDTNNLLQKTRDAANSVVDTLFGDTYSDQNRIAVGIFNKYGYALDKSGNKIEYSSIDVDNGLSTYYFSKSEITSLKNVISNISLDTANSNNGGTNTEGGFLTADKLIQAGDASRQKLVLFMTDGLPTGRYEDSNAGVNTVGTYDYAGNGIPSYAELTESVDALSTLSQRANTSVATIFYAGELDTNNSITLYYNIVEGTAIDSTQVSGSLAGEYYIRSANSNNYLTVADGSADDGANIEQSSFVGDESQTFKLVSAGSSGVYYIETATSDYNSCVNVENGSSSSGANINQSTYSGAKAQKFKFSSVSDGSYAIKTGTTSYGSALDVDGGSAEAGANIIQWSYGGGNNQKWYLEPIAGSSSTTVTTQSTQTVYLKSPDTANMSEEEQYMSAFYKKSDYACASHIVNNLWSSMCTGGVYMPENATSMLEDFKTVVRTFTENYRYEAATAAVYDDIVPNYAYVDESSISVTTGSAQLLLNQDVQIDGEWTTRDIVRWAIGTIPEQKQTLNYSIKIKDDKTYGIMDASVQGILTYTESSATKTHSPLVVQIDEIILAPKGIDDYYVVAQETELHADGNNAPSVKTNDDTTNSLIDTTGNDNDANTIVNGTIAGLNGDQAALNLQDYTTEIVDAPKYGSVTLNDDGTFTYIQNAELYASDPAELGNDANGTDEYNDVDLGWQDSFTYVLHTASATMGNSAASTPVALSDYNVSGNTAVANAETEITSEPITVYIRITPNLGDLSATKSAVPESGSLVKQGDEIEYTISVYNPRTIESEVTVSDYIPSGSTLVENSISNGGSYSDGKITWTVPVAGRATATLSFKVKVDDAVVGTGNLSNAATFTYTTPGSDVPGSGSTNAVKHAVVNGVKSSSVSEGTILNVGDTITYTIAVTNTGSADAANVAVSDKLPEGLTFAGGTGLDYADGMVTGTIANVPADGKPVYVSFTATVNALKDTYGSMSYANTATVNGVPTNEVVNTAKHGKITVYHKYVGDDSDIIPPTEAEGNYGAAYSFSVEDIANYDFVSDSGNTSGTYTDGDISVIFYYDKTPGYATVYYVDTNGGTLALPKDVAGNQGDVLENLYGKIDITHYEYKSTTAPSYTLTEEGITITHIYEFIPDETLPTVSKTSVPATGSLVKSGDTVVYTITVTNNKYEAMKNVQVSDSIPKGMTYVDGSADSNGTYANGIVSWNIANLAVGATKKLTFSATVNGSFDGTGNLSNVASIAYTDTGASTPTKVDTNGTTLAVIGATKSVISSAEFYGVGDQITYRIAVTNYGTAPAYNVAVADAIPAGTTLVSGKNNKTIAVIEPGVTTNVDFTVKVNDFAVGDDTGYSTVIGNTAYVNEVPTNTANATAKKGVVIVRFEDEFGTTLSATKTYTGTPGAVHGDTDKIVIPGYTYASTTGTTTGVFVEGTITIVHIYNKTPASVVIKYLDLESDAVLADQQTVPGYVGDEITDTRYQDITDYDFVKTTQPDEMKYIDGVVTIIHYYSQADDTPPTMVKTADKGNNTIVNAGDTITYSIEFTNSRVDEIKDVVVSDPIPSGTVLVTESATCSVEGIEPVIADGKITWSLESVAAASTVTFGFTVRVATNPTGSNNLSNIAQATYKSRDYTPENPITSNSVKNAVLDSTKKVNKTTAVEGDIVTYTIEVINRGSAAVNNLVVTDTIPSGTSFYSSNDFTFNADGSGSATIASVPANGQAVSVSFSVRIDPMGNDVYTKSIKNVALVNGEQTNETTTEVKMGTLVVNHIDYDGTVLDTSTTRAQAGTSYGPLTKNTYENREWDTTDGSTTGSYTTDTTTVNFHYKRIPAALTIKYLDASTLKPIMIPVSYSENVFLGDAIADEYYIAPAITNYEFVESNTESTSNKIFDATSEVITHYYKYIYDTAALGATKTSDPANGATVKVGDTITYTIEVTNTRYDAVSDVVIIDAIPAGTTFVRADNGGAEADGKVTWNIGSIAAGDFAKVSFTVKVNDAFTAEKNLSNTAGYTFKGADGKDGQGNTGAINHAVLISGKTVDKASATEGEEIAYTITVKNYGGAASGEIVILDTVPASTTLSDVGEFTADGSNLSYVVDSLAAGATKTLTFKVKVDALAEGTYSASIKNTATINDEPTETTETTISMGDVVVKHIDYNGTVLDTETFRAETGTQYGPYDYNSYSYRANDKIEGETSGSVTEGLTEINFYYKRIPATLTIDYVDDVTGNTLKTVTVTGSYLGDKLPDLQKLDIENYTYVELVKNTCADSNIYDDVSELATHHYSYVYDDTSVTATKAAAPAANATVKVGDTITYTIVVNNPRRDAISNVVVTDVIPVGTTYVARSADNSGTEAGGTITWKIASIAAGASKTLTFKAKVSEINSGINLSNQAEVTFKGADGTSESTETNVVKHGYIAAAKTASKTVAAEVETITYTVTVNNYGAAAVNNVLVTDVVPVGTTLKGAGDFTADETGALSATIDTIAAGGTKQLSFSVTVDALGEGVYTASITNTAVVNGTDTNTTTTEIKMGDLVVKHVDYDGTVISTETLREPTGTDYGPYDYNTPDNRANDTVTGETSGKFSDGLTEIVFTYKRIPATLTVKYLDDVTKKEIKTTEVSDHFIGETIPANAYAKSNISGYITGDIDLTTIGGTETAPYKFDSDEVIIHYYTRIMETTIPVITKTSSAGEGGLVKSGDTVTYTINVSNTRELDSLTDVVITDAVPAGMTYVEESGYVVGDEANTIAPDANGVLTWNIGSVAPQTTVTVTFKATVGNVTSGSNLGNTAYVKYVDLQAEEDEKEKTVPSNTTTQAMLHSVKTSSAAADEQLNDGSTIKYTVTVTNVGSAVANDVIITDIVPANTLLVAETLPRSVSRTGSLLSYTVDAIEPGASATFTFEVVVAMGGQYSVDIVNTARVNGDETNTVENFAERGTVATEYVLINPDGTESALPGGAKWGGNVGDALNLPPVDTFELYRYVRTERTSDSNTFIAGNIDVTYYFERIPTTATIKYVDYNTGATIATDKEIDGVYVGDVLDSNYKIDITHYDYLTNDAPATLEVKQDGALVITHYYTYVYDTTLLNQTKTSVPANGSAVKSGDEITYTITVENPRYDAISNVVITDTVPVGSTLKDAPDADVTDGVLTWTIASIEAGGKVSVGFTVTVDSEFDGETNLSNVALIDFTAADGTTEEDLRTNTVEHSLLTAKKSADKSEAGVYDEIIYTIDVNNYGSTYAENVVVTDTIPAGLSFVSTQSDYTFENGTITFVIAKIEAGSSASISFKARVNALADGELTSTIGNIAEVNGEPTNEVTTTVKCGTIVVNHVDTQGNALINPATVTGNVGDEYSYSPSDDITGYTYRETIGEPEGQIIDGETVLTFVYDRTPATVTYKYLEKSSGTPLTEPESEVLAVGDEVTDLHYKNIPGYTYVESETPADLVITDEGIDIIHYYSFTPETYTVSGAAWSDTTVNSIREANDTPVGSVMVTLSDSNDAEVGVLYTDANGEFAFEDVAIGEYNVKFELPADYEVAPAIQYSATSMNSVVDATGSVDISVVGDTENIGVEFYKTQVLGDSDAVETPVGVVEDYKTYTEQYVTKVESIKVSEPVETEQANVLYTKVLGDTDSVPNTGDKSFGTTAAIMVAAASLFILILCRKGK